MIPDLGLCDSFDEDDIEQLQAQLEEMDGPQLRHFQMLQEEQPILAFSCIDIIRGLLDGEGKDLRLVGRDDQAALKAFLYVLLLLGAEQRRNYPHLNTLIRQQFYKPNIFRQQPPSPSDESRAMLEKCLQYFEEVGEGVQIEQYLLREPLFQQACLIMLRNSLQEEEGEAFEQLANKFNVDLRLSGLDPAGECYHLGVGDHYQIIREGGYYFLALSQGRDELNQSKLELQSIRSGESGLHLLVPPEAVTHTSIQSDNSTPKFKNSEVKFRKKSHKNSFGGDLQIVQYRDLLHLQSQKLTINNAKVLSQYFEVNEVESCAEHLDDRTKKHSFQDIIDSQKIDIKVQMKGSTTLPPHHQERRNRKISSSQIIEYHREFTRKEEHKVSEPLQEQEEEDKPHSYNSLVVAKDDPPATPLVARMRTSLIHQKELERIEERQSSQRESHPDQEESEHSEERQEREGECDSHMKLKDRKYSYFTQQMASTTSKKAKQIDSSNYVFRIPKNLHKNSEVIHPLDHHEPVRQRFQQNPLRFSQMGGGPSESSAHESFQQPQKLSQKSLRLASSLYSYQLSFQPINWYKKQIIYHLDSGNKEVQVIHRSYAPSHLPTQDRSLIRESLDSGHTLSNLKMMKNSNFTASHSMNPSISIHPSHSINPYELNQTSFLKNRIHSMANLGPFDPDKDQSKSIVFSTCRSLKNITSPTKISFNYIQPRHNAEQLSTRPQPQPQYQQYSLITTPQTPPSPQLKPAPQTPPLQFRHPPTKQMNASRPQTYSGCLSISPLIQDLRFGRR